MQPYSLFQGKIPSAVYTRRLLGQNSRQRARKRLDPFILGFIAYRPPILVIPVPSSTPRIDPRRLQMAVRLGTDLAEIAGSLRLGSSPLPSLRQLRAKTITFIIFAREIVPEQTARGIARQLVSGTRLLTPLADGDRPAAIAA
jgi:hypothetical protein